MAPVIQLGQQPKSNNVIFLGSPPKKRTPFKQRLTSLLVKTAVFEAGVLGTLTGGLIGGAKAAGLTALGLGILQTSPKARKFVKEKIKDPTAGGRFIGGQIEKIGKQPLPSDKKLKEKIKEGLVKAGVLGAVAAGGVGAVVAGKEIVKRVKKVRVPKVPSIVSAIPSIPRSLRSQPLISQPLPSQIEPLAPVKKKKPVAVTPTMPTINNKISVKPEINISFRKTRKFINQQILIKA